MRGRELIDAGGTSLLGSQALFDVDMIGLRRCQHGEQQQDQELAPCPHFDHLGSHRMNGGGHTPETTRDQARKSQISSARAGSALVEHLHIQELTAQRHPDHADKYPARKSLKSVRTEIKFDDAPGTIKTEGSGNSGATELRIVHVIMADTGPASST